MVQKTFPAEDSALNDWLAFAEEALERADCPMKAVMAVTVALEEVFVNVAHYAYPGSTGSVTLAMDFDAERRAMTFQVSDRGIPFNPLSTPDPDITLPAEQRQIGGLGIYMVKKSMDRVDYRYENGQNILTMQKLL